MKTVPGGRFWALIAVLFVLGAASVAWGQYTPNGGRPRTPQPPPDPPANPVSLKGQIRWKKLMGMPQYHVNPGDTACSEFELYVYEPVPARHDVLLRGWHINQDVHDDGDYYYCTFSVDSQLQLGHRYHIEAGFRDPNGPLPVATDTTVWAGGPTHPHNNSPRVVYRPDRDVLIDADHMANTEDFEVLFKSEIFNPSTPVIRIP